MILTWLLKVKGSEGTGLALDCTERKFATKKAHFACLGISEYLQAEPKPFGVPPVRLPLLQLLLFFSLLLSLSLLLLLLVVSNCLILVATFWPLVTSSFPILSLKISPPPSLIVTSALAKSLCEEQFLFPYPRIKSAEHHGLFKERESQTDVCAARAPTANWVGGADRLFVRRRCCAPRRSFGHTVLSPGQRRCCGPKLLRSDGKK